MPYHRPDRCPNSLPFTPLAHCVNLSFNMCATVVPFPSTFNFCINRQCLLVYERNKDEPSLEHAIPQRGV